MDVQITTRKREYSEYKRLSLSMDITIITQYTKGIKPKPHGRHSIKVQFIPTEKARI